MTSLSFLILFACSPCAEVGQGRVTELEVLGIALAEGGAALQRKPRPPPRLAEVAPEDEGGAPNEGRIPPSIKALIWAS